MTRVLIWDVPTRLFHWLLAACFAVAWITSSSDRWLSLHSFAGYVMLGLVGFRLLWGLVGGRYARFASFAYGAAAVAGYLRRLRAGTAERYLGHNPAGSVAIYLMLALGLATCVTGVFTQGGEEQQLLAAGLLGVPAGTLVRRVHEMVAWTMLLLVGVHLAGIAVDGWLTKENLPLSMLTGSKEAARGTVASGRHALVGGLMLLAIATFAAWWFSYAWHAAGATQAGAVPADGTAGVRPVAFVGRRLPDDPTWREECGSCHLAFHPNLMPERSWRRIMLEQATHFGTDLALDASTAASVLDFMVRNAAERSTTEAAWKINLSVAAGSTPLRITGTPYWVTKHAGIAADTWKRPSVKGKANCGACHIDADAGTFEDAAMRLPP